MAQNITIVGLGPGSNQHWTLAAYWQLTQASEVYLRTSKHPSVDDIPVHTIHFDEWYRLAADPEQLYDLVAAKIVDLGQRDIGVTYAVPGHPYVGETTVPRILALAEKQQVPVTIIPGLSFIEPTMTLLGINALDNLQIIDAIEMTHQYYPPINPDKPALIGCIYGQEREVIEKVTQLLLNAYRDDFDVTMIRGAGTAFESLSVVPLAELEQQPDWDETVTLYLPADESNVSFVTFQQTIAHLFSPGGCPWDKKQTHQTLRAYLLEETYEVLETLDANDLPALAEELGDLLLQIALHTQMATRDGNFKWGDVIGHINRKMIRRHPHVFDNVTVDGPDEVFANWEAIKKTEKATKGNTEISSALDGVPPGLPALAEAMMLSKKAVRVGFEWDNINGALEKVIEEVKEFAEATEPDHMEAEMGDILFSVVNLARWQNIDPESALRATNARFIQRFQKMEQLAKAQEKTLTDMSLLEMKALWQTVKQMLKDNETV
jgi:tetrapyrrole methylase family protein/MazG family protein